MQRTPRRRAVRTAAIATLALASLIPAVAGAQDPWESENGNQYNSRYASRGISAGKAPTATRLWSAIFSPADGEASGTPLIAENGLIYVSTTKGQVMAFVRDSGVKYWQTAAAGPKPQPIYNSLLLAKGKLWALVSQPRANFIVEMEPLTGKVLSRTLVNNTGNVEAVGGLQFSPETGLIYIPFCACKAEENRVNTSVRGAIIAWDPITKTNRWVTATSVYGGGNVWGQPLVLDELDRVYVATGHATRSGPAGRTDPYANSIIALDSMTGDVEGVFQARAGDAARNDAIAPLNRLGFEAPLNASNGAGVFNIGAGSRDGYYYAVNAVTMELVYRTLVAAPTSEGGVTGASATSGSMVFGHGVPGLLYGIKSRTGTLSAAFPTEDTLAYGAVTYANGLVWYSSTAGVLHAADAATGRPVARLPLGAPSTTGVAIGKYRVVAGLGTGKGTPGGIVVFK